MFEVETKKTTYSCEYSNNNGYWHSECRTCRYKVYNVRDDGNGYPQFLIFEDGQWRYKSAKYFTPVEKENTYEEY